MPDVITDGRTKVWSVPSIVNIAAPTVAELNAGTTLECLITPDGLVGFEPETSDIDNSSLCSVANTKIPGREDYSNTMLRLKKQTGVDTVYNTLVRDYITHIVIRRDILATTAWAAGDKVEVYPTQLGQVRNLAPEANSLHKYEVPTKVTNTTNLRATVAA